MPFISPAVHIQEKDLSFISQGVSEIGATIIGPFLRGPAFVPTIINTQTQRITKFGDVDESFYSTYCAEKYLKNAGTVTLVRVLGIGGYDTTGLPLSTSFGIVAVLAPAKDNIGESFSQSSLLASSSTAFTLHLSSSTVSTSYALSLDEDSANYIENVFGSNPQGTKPVYVYKSFKTSQAFLTSSHVVSLGSEQTLDFSFDYNEAQTPWILSQQIDSSYYQLFRFAMLSHGNSSNTELKVSISDVKYASEIQNSDYGTFTVTIRKFDDTDLRPITFETFTQCTLDPNSANYLPRRIGDKYFTVDSNGKITLNGDYDNKSDYIRVVMDTTLDPKALPPQVVPLAFNPLTEPILGSTAATASIVTAQLSNNTTNTKIHFGLDFSKINTKEYFAPIPANATTGSNAIFNLENYGAAGTGTVSNRKFTVGFQEGFDGWAPTTIKNLGSNITAGNVMGFNCSSTTASGTIAYRKALNAISNPDEYDLNLIVTPGILHRLHPTITNYAITIAEERADCFFVMDPGSVDDNVTATVDAVSSLDSSYAGTYYPWMKILDINSNKRIWVPPSVVIPSIYAFNDQLGEEWSAPAGLNRGGVNDASEVYTRLTKAERDELYEGRVNPIATFSNQGIVVWGQKTLQVKASALDRINVRRLLLMAEKFVSTVSRNLLFEPNVAATRNRFLNQVNPFFESIQQRNGLFAFRVAIGEAENPPDVVDRNQIKGAIFLQPSKTGELFIIDFNLLRTGATFDQ